MVSGQLHAPAALPPAPITRSAVSLCNKKPVCVAGIRNCSVLCRWLFWCRSGAGGLVGGLVIYTECAILYFTEALCIYFCINALSRVFEENILA